MLKEEALSEKKMAVRRKAVAMLQQAQASLSVIFAKCPLTTSGHEPTIMIRTQACSRYL